MNVREQLKKGYIVFDGGQGTQFQKMGMLPGTIPETLNVTNPNIRESVIYLLIFCEFLTICFGIIKNKKIYIVLNRIILNVPFIVFINPFENNGFILSRFILLYPEIVATKMSKMLNIPNIPETLVIILIFLLLK